ncbi:hypothetical protein BBM62_14160 [Vibrio parahaemolyticus]|uniref:SIR2 family protein n=1 Tax=Vibrio parahaemolyticus TaxID=670 RepID=UPI00084ABF79|nr:SIR2 family protein [Vibrio parahaemolyticus]OEA43734.1 hypothetical protein BBM62_14160 [Vibrio parahaemolyticus]
MEVDKVKQRLQQFFTQKPLVVIGSGLSTGEGISGMWGLSQHLKAEIPNRVKGNLLDDWRVIEEQIDNDVMFEEAMSKLKEDSELVPHIIEETTALISSDERAVFSDVIRQKKELALSKLLPFLTHNQNELVFITPNYDRLIELACENSNLAILTGFNGYYVGEHVPTVEEEKVKSIVSKKGIGGRPVYATTKRIHAKIFKPHGSLDWYDVGGRIVRTQAEINEKRLIITPGTSKFRAGYQNPFDYHREKANNYIQRAHALLVIAYGFNDEQLEVHLKQRMLDGVPTLVITKEMSTNAKKVCTGRPNILIVEELEHGSNKTKVTIEGDESVLDCNWWNLNEFVSEVLK